MGPREERRENLPRHAELGERKSIRPIRYESRARIPEVGTVARARARRSLDASERRHDMLRGVGVPSPRATPLVARVRSSDAVRSPARARGPPGGCRRSFAYSIPPDALRTRAPASPLRRRTLETRAASDEVKVADPLAGAGSETLAPGRADSGADASTSAPSVPVARATLLLVPLLWATYNPALRFIYESPTAPTPAELSAVRMLISLVPFSFVLAGVARDEARRRDPAADASGRNLALLTRAGMELGALNAAGTAFQAYGLELTSSTRAGFLLSTINVLVPLGAAASGQRVAGSTWAAVALALAGVAVTEAAGAGNQTLTLDTGANVGDACCLAAAALYAAFTVRLGAYASRLDAAELSAAKAAAMTGLCVAWVAAERTWFGVVGDAPNGGAWGSVLWTSDGAGFAALWGAVAYSAVGPGALANWLQTRGQAAVPAAEAQLIFATTPVFNAALSIAFLGESAGSNTLVGGAIILAASLLPAALGEDEREDEGEDEDAKR